MTEIWYDEPTAGLEDLECFPLHRYAALLGHDEFAFFGITDAAYVLPACDSVWNCSERLRLARALLQAQQMIELELGFPLCGQFICDEEQRSNGNLYRYGWERFKLDWGYVQAIGEALTTVVSAAEALTYGADERDPATLTVAAGLYSTSYSLDDLCFYEEDTEHKLYPSKIERADSGALTVTFPKSRLVKTEDECDDEILITDDTKFIENVDVKYCSIDATAGVTIIQEPPLCDYATMACAGQSTTGCGFISTARLGHIRVQPAVWDADDGQWDRRTLCWKPDKIQLTYKAGYQRSCNGKWVQADWVVLWLALSLLPSPPCGCTAVREFWTQNLKPAPVISRAELAPPWGASDGAWKAWQFVQRFGLGRGGLAFYGF